MKRLLFISLLLASVICQAQTIIPQVSFNTLNDLKMQVGTQNVQVLLNGLSSTNDSNGGTYMWDGNSTATPNDFTVVQVNGVTTGRWVRIGNGNTIKGTVTFSGITLQSSYTVPYQNGPLPFVPITVLVIPRSQNAAALSFIPAGGITNTGFTVTFLTVPILGTNNIVFDYIVVKQ